jgi:3-phenylpropionate/cinnamic acid dioxygenase small subunit
MCDAMGAGTWESHHAITTLMFRYAECVDAADFDGIGELFADAVITNEGVAGEIAGAEAVKQLYLNTNRVHDDGTLRTRHLTANVQVDIEEAAGTAAARSASSRRPRCRCSRS